MRPRSDLHNWPTKRPIKPGHPYYVHASELRAAELRDAIRPRPVYGRSTSIIETWMCERCREYTLEGSHALGRCITCKTPRP